MLYETLFIACMNFHHTHPSCIHALLTSEIMFCLQQKQDAEGNVAIDQQEQDMHCIPASDNIHTDLVMDIDLEEVRWCLTCLVCSDVHK